MSGKLSFLFGDLHHVYTESSHVLSFLSSHCIFSKDFLYSIQQQFFLADPLTFLQHGISTHIPSTIFDRHSFRYYKQRLGDCCLLYQHANLENSLACLLHLILKQSLMPMALFFPPIFPIFPLHPHHSSNCLSSHSRVQQPSPWDSHLLYPPTPIDQCRSVLLHSSLF